ncbi:MAG: hypothetical protein WC494_03345 [Candidatus Pacearchaeota archaeon]
MKNNKKGVSAVIATVLIILITIAAVTIIWAAIIPMIKGLIESGTTCLDVMKEVELGDRTCLVDNDTVTVQVVRGSTSFEWADIQVRVEDEEGNTASSYLVADEDEPLEDLPGRNEAQTFTLNITGLNSELVNVAIAPVVQVDGKQENCGVTSTKKLIACP